MKISAAEGIPGSADRGEFEKFSMTGGFWANPQPYASMMLANSI